MASFGVIKSVLDQLETGMSCVSYVTVCPLQSGFSFHAISVEIPWRFAYLHYFSFKTKRRAFVIQIILFRELYSEYQMAEIPNSSKGSFKNEVFKRSSSGTRDKNVCKQQKREDYPVQMLPAMSASGVDAYNGSGSCNDPSVEISPKEKSLKAAHKLDLNSTLPDLNEAAPPELMSITDVDKGSNFQNEPSFVANDFLEAVQVVRKLEIEGHISGIFRTKFLSFLGLKATAKERDVVRAFIQGMGDDPSCLAGQLIDSFSGVVNMKA